ncbi:hypothetical protein TELCIR_01433 [Teladorsagia circumcincta]|uniref:Uncharacterized protein n=1 Tax=Teladorsagia circumcincta TaxID=45464 RepID=A0A2G9V1X9_TELCI|nr:hypothetical protein TELCIR_01433 [Teladorsagia circumcincta]
MKRRGTFEMSLDQRKEGGSHALLKDPEDEDAKDMGVGSYASLCLIVLNGEKARAGNAENREMDGKT